MYIDFSNLNAICSKDGFPLSQIYALVNSTARYLVMSFLNVFLGYQQFHMHPTNLEMTIFITGEGIYYYRVMPFVLKNVRANYQILVY